MELTRYIESEYCNPSYHRNDTISILNLQHFEYLVNAPRVLSALVQRLVLALVDAGQEHTVVPGVGRQHVPEALKAFASVRGRTQLDAGRVRVAIVLE